MSTEATTVAIDTVNALFKKFIGPFSATMIPHLLAEPSSIEERVGALVLEFNAHPHLIGPFRKLVSTIQNKEIAGPIEEQIRFIQTTQARNYLFVNLFNDVLDIKELKLDPETGRLPGKPKDLIKFSTSAKIAFGEESRYKDLVGAVGLLFDFAFYLQKTQIVELNGIKLDEFIEASFKKGVEQGKLIIRLSRHKANLTNEKYAPIVPMLRQLSHVVFCLLYPNIGPEFYKKLSSIRYTEPLKLALEMKEFGIHSGMLSSYIAESFSIFDLLGEVMSVWGAPHLAHYTQNPAIADLAGIAELGVLLKENYRVSDLPETSKVGAQIPELKFMDFILTAQIKEDLEDRA